MTIQATLAPADAAAAWDAAVIGAGPAGAVTARALARHGLRTLLIDKAQFPRRKVCGGCLNANAFSALAAAGLGELPARLGAVPLRAVRLATGGHSAVVRWPGGVSLSREALDAELVREAIAAGAAFLPGARAAMRREHGGPRQPVAQASRLCESGTGETPVPRAGHTALLPIELEHTGRHYAAAARVVVVADGLNGRLAAAEAGSRIGAGVILDDAPADYAPGTVLMAVGRGGYVGLVRVEDGRLDVAAAFDAGFVRTAGGLGPAAVAVIGAAGLPPVPSLERAPWRGTPALTRTPRRVAGRRWFAVGDAAGYVEPFTGEGIGWAVSSAVALAPIAARAAQRWDDALIGEWSRTHRTVVGRRRTCRAIAWVLRRPGLAKAVVRVVSAVPDLAYPVVRTLHRPAFLPRELRP